MFEDVYETLYNTLFGTLESHLALSTLDQIRYRDRSRSVYE